MWSTNAQQTVRSSSPPIPLSPSQTLLNRSGVLGANADRRREERFALPSHITLSSETPASDAELCDISPSGAFVAAGPIALTDGAGLRLEFTLPQGFRVNAFGRVAWVRTTTDEYGPAGYGVQFYGLDDLNREFIQYYLDLVQSGVDTPVTGGRIQTRFAATASHSNQLHVHVSGSLLPLEAETLEAVVCREIATLYQGTIFVYLDVQELGACSKASLEYMRNWLERLRHNRELLGVMVGSNTIGVVQFRRMAREAGVADALINFSTSAEALAFWNTLVGFNDELAEVA